MSRPPRVRPSRAKATVAAAAALSSSIAVAPSIAAHSSVVAATSAKELKDVLLFNGADTGTDSDRDDDRTAKAATGSGRDRDRDRDRERDRDRRKREANHAVVNHSKPRVDKPDRDHSSTSANGATTAANSVVSTKRKPPSSTTISASSNTSATTTAAASKPKHAAKQHTQRAAVDTDSPEGEVYCVCRLPNTGEAMICCEECDEWYHFRCIGMTAAEAARTEHYVCAACKRLHETSKRTGAKEVDGKKRRRDEDAGKAAGARVNGVDGELEGKRTRRQRNGITGEEREEEMGDGTGKWLKKDMVVESESDEEEWVYMTSDDDEQPQQQPTNSIKLESTTVKQEDGLVAVSPSASFSSTSPPSSVAIHRLPRVFSPAVSFDRPDYRLHPLIHQTSPRAPRQSRSSSPTRALVASLVIECAISMRSVVQHRWLAALQEPDRQFEGHVIHQMHRCVQRWQTVLEEYEWEETKRQMQLAAEEWRWRRLVDHYLKHELDTVPQSDDGIRPPPTAFELLLSSALPVGLGHPRFVHDTQEVVNAAHEKSIQSEAISSFQSQQTTPSSYAAPTAVSTTSSSTSRLTFHFHRVKRDPADFVSLETLWCVGCGGYIPVDEYATHIRDCCETPITTPDQKLVVVMPYEQPISEPLAVEIDAPTELERLAVMGDVEDEEVSASRKEKDDAMDKVDATKWELGDKPDAIVLAMARLHHQLATMRALSLQFDARQHSSDPTGRFPLREYLNKPPPVPKLAEPKATPVAPITAVPQPPQSRLSMAPAPRLITRHQRFLNPALFPTLLCGYPLLSASHSVCFCAHLQSTCVDHSGWEERWDMERRAARLRLEGRLRAVKTDTDGLKRVLDVEERERMAGKAAFNSATQSVTSSLSAYLEADKPAAVNEASPAASELSDGSSLDMEEETAVEAHTLQRRPGPREDSSLDNSSDAEDTAEANGTTATGGDKKRTDRERLRERERINKQRQRERAKAREREKEMRMREKERSREKKREKRKRKEKERERKERRRDKDRHTHKSSKKKSGSRSGVRRRDESSSSDQSSNSSDERSDDSRTSMSSDTRDY